MKDIIIIGAGGLGREVAWTIERINCDKKTWNILGFVDDDITLTGRIVNGYTVLGTTSYLKHHEGYCVVCAIGNPKTRECLVHKLSDKKFATIIDPSSIISKLVDIGSGTIILGCCYITTNIKVGNNCIINYGVTIGHDTNLSDYSIVYPGSNISGNVTIGKCVEVGTGSQIIQGKIIGDNSIIGAGSVVITNIASNCVAVGVPCKVIKNIYN